MIAGRTVAVIPILLVAILPLPAFAEPADRNTKELIRIVRKDEDAAAWMAAVRGLREQGGDAIKLLEKELERLHRLRSKHYETLVKKVERLAGPDEEDKPTAKLRTAWETARKAARDFIFDEKQFPAVRRYPFVSPGHTLATVRGDEAMEVFQPLQKRLRRLVHPPSATDAGELLSALRRTEESLDRVIRELRAEGPAARPSARALLILEAAAGEFGTAAKRYDKLPEGYPRLTAFHAYSEAILAGNEERRSRMANAMRRGLLLLNGYRISLGHSPLALHGALMHAAEGHSVDMQEYHYFGHESPNPELRTMERRAARAGYKGTVSENIYAGPSLVEAFDVWRKSGLHHRTLVSPKRIEAGVGAVGSLTMVFGWGEKGSPPVLVY